MSEVWNWGKMFVVPGKGGHSPLALLGGFCLLLREKKNQSQSCRTSCTSAVLAASGSEVFSASAT